MPSLQYDHHVYKTPSNVPISAFSRWFPSLSAYLKLFMVVYRASRQVKRGRYNREDWVHSSLATLQALESVGIRVEVSGAEHLKALDGPCLIIANHMSTFETFALPCITAPYTDITYVVKEPLLNYPIFKQVVAACDPIAVGQDNPRSDLKVMIEESINRLDNGLSVVIFPQSTRLLAFNRRQFNSIGIKIAQRANVPIMPLALKTDAWGLGKLVMDVGRMDPSKTAHFRFGKALQLVGKGREEQQHMLDFIETQLENWKAVVHKD